MGVMNAPRCGFRIGALARRRLSGAPQLRAALAEDPEGAVCIGHLELEARGAAERHGARGAARLPIHDAADLAYVARAVDVDRVRPNLVATLRPEIQQATLLADDRLLGLAAAVIDDFVSVGVGVARKIDIARR